MATVRLPRLLEPAVGKTRDIRVTGASVLAAVADLLERHPTLRVHLFDEEHRLRPHVLCFVEGTSTRLEVDQPLADGDEITFLHAVSGGSQRREGGPNLRPMADRLRPIERRVLDLRDKGHDLADIARRFRRSPDHIERIITWSQVPKGQSRSTAGLRPIERRVLALRQEGASYEEIGQRFRRGPDHIRRIEGYARLREGLDLLG